VIRRRIGAAPISLRARGRDEGQDGLKGWVRVRYGAGLQRAVSRFSLAGFKVQQALLIYGNQPDQMLHLGDREVEAAAPPFLHSFALSFQ
jgi:hypothetical protein